MQQSSEIDKLAAALAKAQKTFQSIARDKIVSVKMKSGGVYTFAYAPLESIMAAVRPSLVENGLAITQGVEVLGEDKLQWMRSTLVHESGQWLSNLSPVVMGTESGPQAYGSAVTYARRYGVTQLLCIVAEDDNDANGAEGNGHASAKIAVGHPSEHAGMKAAKSVQELVGIMNKLTAEEKKLYSTFYNARRQELAEVAA